MPQALLLAICGPHLFFHHLGRWGPRHSPSLKPWLLSGRSSQGSCLAEATEVTFRVRHKHFLLKNTTFRAPAIIPNFTKCCTCHKKWHLNFTKNCACHAKWLSWLICVTYETLYTMRGATEVSLQHHQTLRLPRKMTLMIDPRHIWKVLTMRGATGVILQHHRILRLPRKMTLMIDPRHEWNVIYNERSNKGHPTTSPNTAPATQNDSHDWSSSHMKRYLQCAEQQRLPSNITKYCACHAKWLSWLIRVTYETLYTMRGATGVILQHHWILRLPRKMTDAPKFHRNFSQTDETSFTMRSRSDHDPRMKPSVRKPPRNRGYFSRSPQAFSIKKYNISRSGSRLSFQISPNFATATKSDTWTSPNIAPATQNDSHDWSASHMKRYLQCAEQQRLPSNITKNCACHAKWLSWLIRVTYETLFTMRGATEVTLQHHQKLRLPRKMILMIDPRHIWNVIYNARSNRGDPPTSPNTVPATQNDSHDWSASHMKRYLQCAEQRLPSNITKNCACHAKWLSWLIRVTYETLYTMRGATGVILQHHWILRLPRKMSDAPKFHRNFSQTDETSFTMRDRSEQDPTMIRPQSDRKTVRPQPASQPRLLFAPTASVFYWKILQNTTFRAPAIIPNFTKCCTCHEKWHLNFTNPEHRGLNRISQLALQKGFFFFFQNSLGYWFWGLIFWVLVLIRELIL